MHISYLSIGSNLGEKEYNLSKAVSLLEERGVKIISSSELYETEPWGFKTADQFLNKVIKVRTPYEPEEFLRIIKKIELQMGRTKSELQNNTYESRIIDIDILFYEQRIVSTPSLQIPHLKIEERKFVLEPLVSISPEWIHPLKKVTLTKLLEQCNDDHKIRMVKV